LSQSGIVNEEVEASIAGQNLTNQFLSGCVIPQVGGKSKDTGSFYSGSRARASILPVVEVIAICAPRNASRRAVATPIPGDCPRQ
jgi:hypothetical protein